MRLMHLAAARGRHWQTGFRVLAKPIAQAPYRNVQQFSRTSAIAFAVSKRTQDVSALDLGESGTDLHVRHLRHLFNAEPPTAVIATRYG
jgi:hypothetical protein